MRKYSDLIAILSLIGFLGCSGGNERPPQMEVTGKVTLDGKPLSSARITFEEPNIGTGGSAELSSDGSYSVMLQKGTYLVAIEPEMIVEEGDGNSPPIEVYKDNVPDKYLSSETSELKAEISSEKRSHDFALE